MIEKKLEVFLTDRLKESQVVSCAEQKKFFDEKKKTGKRFVELVDQLALRSRVEVLKLLSEFHHIPYIDIEKCREVDRATLKLIPEKLIRYFKVFPVGRVKDQLTVAMIDPADVVLVDRLGQYARCEIVPAFATEDAIQQAIERFLGPVDSLGQEIRKMEGQDGTAQARPKIKEIVGLSSTSTANVVNLVNLIIEKAIDGQASDIHLEPSEKSFYVRYRIDGVLHDYSPMPPKSMEAAVISRLKVMSDLDIAEKRLPQDGRILFQFKNRDVNLRISTFPTIYGENVVIRVLDRSESCLTLEELGMASEDRTSFERLVNKPNGIILVTGPTGSGKTTTLYAALERINTVERHIMTLEDPVEYRLDRVRQSQIDPKSGLTFARGLRSIMRQDPDVIMIGEIRDLETATIAIQAALTGHLVLSTLHTNDAPSAVTRLLDMGVEPFLISSSVSCVLAQRLLRTLCKHCKRPQTPERASLEEIGLGQDDGGLFKKGKAQFYQDVGCDQCKQTGFQGRIGAFELMIPNDEIRSLIVKKASAEVIRKVALANHMTTLKQDGFRRAADGLTTINEVLRVTQEF